MSEEQIDPSQETRSEVEAPLTQKQIADRRRDLKHYFKNQIEDMKPQVELAELRARFSKATYDNYRYSIEINKIENQDKELKDAEESLKAAAKVQQEELSDTKAVETGEQVNTSGLEEAAQQAPVISISKTN